MGRSSSKYAQAGKEIRSGFKAGVVNEVDVSKRPFEFRWKDTYETKALIVAAGLGAFAGAEGEKELIGRGFPPARLRRLFFRDKPRVTAAAIRDGRGQLLSRYATKVH